MSVIHQSHRREIFTVCVFFQWKYDQMTATYLLLLAKKHQGRPVRLRAECPTIDSMYSPLQDIQVSSIFTYLGAFGMHNGQLMLRLL